MQVPVLNASVRILDSFKSIAMCDRDTLEEALVGVGINADALSEEPIHI